jgi:hypothetical protein
MEDQRQDKILRSSEGQAIVEYVMLLVVVSAFASIIFKSQTFQDYLGPNSNVFTSIAKRMEYSYRYGSDDVEDPRNNDSYTTSEHELYKIQGQSRFAGPEDPYD